MRRTALLFVVMAAACVSVGKSVLDTSFQASPIAEEDVFVYVAGDSIPEHTRVAMLDAKRNRNLSTTMGHSPGLIREQCPVW